MAADTSKVTRGLAVAKNAVEARQVRCALRSLLLATDPKEIDRLADDAIIGIDGIRARLLTEGSATV